MWFRVCMNFHNVSFIRRLLLDLDFYFYTVIKKLQTQEVSLRSKENRRKAENASYLMPTLWAYESKYQSNKGYCVKQVGFGKMFPFYLHFLAVSRNIF